MTMISQDVCVGAVVIGRNEGQRLIACLNALKLCIEHIVYVDSGSTDESVPEAEKAGVAIVNLDMRKAFTAARARNEGAQHLLTLYPQVTAIQFIDGDCEIRADWIDTANLFLTENPGYAVVCGRRRERYPEQSIYNRLCDIEWDTPVGDTMACGGDALIRVEAYMQVNGYRDDLIAGEEPEMCFRLRQHGWKIYRHQAEMTLHDAAIIKFGQWWKRTVRAGYAYGLGSSIHGRSDERYWVREKQRIILWGIALPLIVAIAAMIDCNFLLMLLLYPVQIARLAFTNKKRLQSIWISAAWASAIVIGKFAEAQGLIRFFIDKYRNTATTIIEYKK